MDPLESAPTSPLVDDSVLARLKSPAPSLPAEFPRDEIAYGFERDDLKAQTPPPEENGSGQPGGGRGNYRDVTAPGQALGFIKASRPCAILVAEAMPSRSRCRLLTGYLELHFLVMGFASAGCGTLAIAAAIGASFQLKRLQAVGLPVEATVIGRSARLDAFGAPTYEVRLAFRTPAEASAPEPVELSLSQEIAIRFDDVNEYQAFREGQSVQLVYDPEKPSRAALKETLAANWWSPLPPYAAIGGFFVIVGCVFLGRQLRRVFLLTRGVAVTGEVLEVRPDGSLKYAFFGPDGLRREGDCMARHRFASGDQVSIVYEAKRPGRHLCDIYGYRAS